jgi:hypothetical protein
VWESRTSPDYSIEKPRSQRGFLLSLYVEYEVVNLLLTVLCLPLSVFAIVWWGLRVSKGKGYLGHGSDTGDKELDLLLEDRRLTKLHLDRE